MATQKKFICPPTPASGIGTFSDDLVGFQLVQGGGLTQGNFNFTSSITEKSDRTFYTGVFSEPINLENLGIVSIEESKIVFENNFKVYPNFDLEQVTNFVQFGSMVKRISASITKIISYYPAALEVNRIGLNYKDGPTATNISYDVVQDLTTFQLTINRIRNPFEIDFTSAATRNLELREIEVSALRNMTVEYAKYSLYYSGNGYSLKRITPTNSLTTGTLTIVVNGNPFSGLTTTYDAIVIRPNDMQVNQVFSNNLDEVENFLLNRNDTPIYTATFRVPKEADDGTFYVSTDSVTWPMNGVWNIDIMSNAFEQYLVKLNQISEYFDSFRTNLISRFLTTGSYKDFDTIGQKMEKVLQIYGRSFDEVNKFINALAFMNSVNYNVGDDIPSKLLKNLAQTLGWSTNISPISNEDFLGSVFGEKNNDQSSFSGVGTQKTPDELNYQYYRNLILNSAYLFKSKGTRKSIEILMRLIGAPDALVEFNEFVYLVDQKINISQFNTYYAQISGGTYVTQSPQLDPSNIFSIFGITYTGFTTSLLIQDVDLVRDNYPVDDEGFPLAPESTEDYYFQMGAGWFESTPSHRSPEIVNLTNSVFTGSNPNYQTELAPFTYGQIYLNRFRDFPYMNLGFNLAPMVDNNKSWVDNEVGLRLNRDSSFNARYTTQDDRLVLNVKNVDLFLNPAQGIAYDVWYMSTQVNYPIPNQGLFYPRPTRCNPNPRIEYPYRGGVDWTEMNPQPKRKTFFEFAQTFWKNMINVRNRQFQTDGKTSAYPTLQSIFWKYIESEKLAGLTNNNFKYQNMMEYVNGLGDYWIRLVEQMVPATTIWNTGIRYENSIFHRQKFVWRRQAGCQLVPVPCRPCIVTTDIYDVGCAVTSVTCQRYPFSSNPQVPDFDSILGLVLNTYLNSIGYSLNQCELNTLTSEWFVILQIDNVQVVSYPAYNGVGYTGPLSSPSTAEWDFALNLALSNLDYYGYGYYFGTNDDVIIYDMSCSTDNVGVNIKIDVGINFNILCS
jgi:hypothetical protein